MKQTIKRLMPVLVLFLFILMSCHSSKMNTPKQELAIAEFDQFIEDIANNYAYLDQRQAIFNCIKSTYRDQTATISTIGEHIQFYEIILDELYDSHIHLNTNTEVSYRLNAPIYAITKKNSTIISNVWQTQMDSALKLNIIGAEILSINGLDFQEAIDLFPTKCQNKQNQEIRTWIGNKIIAGRWNEPRILKLQLNAGEVIQLNLDTIKIKEEDSYLNHKVVDSIGIIRFNNTLGELKLIGAFDEALNKMMDTKALILDLRNTVDGGDTEVALPILGRFISKEQAYQAYENKEKKYLGYVKPRKPMYVKTLVVLVNRWTGSMGEGVAVAFDGMNRATIIGTEMERLKGGMTTYPFQSKDYGYRISFEKIFHIDGTPREEFVPKVYVRQTQLIEDEILNHAIKMIKNKEL